MLILEIAAGVALAPMLFRGGVAVARWAVNDLPIWWLGHRNTVLGGTAALTFATIAALSQSH